MQTVVMTVGDSSILLDQDDFEQLKGFKWRVNDKGYAICDHKGKTLKMHHMVCMAPEGLVVDHRNRNRLDNRRCNLRTVTPRVNALNRTPCRQVKGVYKNAGKFEAKIKVMGKLIYIGRFATEDEAAKAYQDIASLVNEE